MDLQLKDKLFVVTGATSGFGKSIANGLANEEAKVIINARRSEILKEMTASRPDHFEIVEGDIMTDATISELSRKIGTRKLAGILINAGGPPTKAFLETQITDWDDAYEKVLRWKIKITHKLISKFIEQKYGRIVYIESASVKQPIENLVLSNSLRLAVVGFVKTLSQEVAPDGVTLNIIAPGYHATPAMERLFINKGLLLGIPPEQAQKEFEKEIRTGKLGDPDELATLALWLLSPHSAYLTGQTITMDGGLVSNVL